MEGFNYDAHTMAMLVSVMGALSTFYPDARNIRCQRFLPGEPEVCDIGTMEVHIKRLIGTVPKVAACSYRHSRGLPYIYPYEGLSYTGNLLHMLFGEPDAQPEVDPDLEKALDTLFILHAEHGQNCSTTTMRCIGSTQADPYACMAGAAAALYGPLHGGADEAVVAMLREIGSTDAVPAYMDRVKAREAPLPGFGHRLYRTRDPRVAIIKEVADRIFGDRGPSQLMQLALEMERVASEDAFFASRNLYPNTEFYSGILYEAMGLPLDMMSVLFAIPRTVGWLANWREGLTDEAQRIYRPRHIYTGSEARDYVPIDERG
jgi:citrate synthase